MRRKAIGIAIAIAAFVTWLLFFTNFIPRTPEIPVINPYAHHAIIEHAIIESPEPPVPPYEA